MKKPILFAVLFVMVLASVAAILQSGWTQTTNPGVARTALGVPGLTNNNAFTGSNFISGYIASQNGSGTNIALTGSTNWGSVGRSNWTMMSAAGWENTNNGAANQGVRISRGQVVIDGGGTNTTQLSVGGTDLVVGTNRAVGVGVASPMSTFHVRNTTGAAISVFDSVNQSLLQFLDGGVAKSYFGWSSTGQDGMSFFNAAGSVQNMLVTDTGNVGIGTITPADRLHVGINSGHIVFGAPTAGYGGIAFGNAAVSLANFCFMGNGVDAFFGRPSGGDIHFREANGLDQVTIKTSTGNVGIGTNAPNAKLDVSGTVKLGTNGTVITSIRHGISGAMVLGTVTVTDARCTANTRYFFSAHTLGTISIPGGYYASTRTAGTSFVITSSQSTETSTIDWMAVEP